MISAIEKIQRHVKRIKDGKDPKVCPGSPARFTEAATVNDCIRQGDLYLVIVATIPAGYVRIAEPKDTDRQLVPGNTQGAKHCLDSLAGVELYRPADWSDDSLEGPCFKLSEERTVLHPVHGAVTIPAGMTVQCHYQRSWDQEAKATRRAKD